MREQISFKLEVKSLADREFVGHGSVFGNVDLGGDVVIPGAFKRSLREHHAHGTLPQMFWSHQPDQVPGKWLAMEEDKHGLAVKGVLADTVLGNDMRTLLKMQAVRGLSMGYRTRDADYDGDVRLLKDVDLWEVSLVSLAMNPLAHVEATKARLSRIGEWVPTEREFETLLRSMGCSKNVSRLLIAKIFDEDLTGGMLEDGHRWDAEEPVDRAASAALEAIARMTDKVGAASFSR